MRVTVALPWFTYTRRLGVALALLLLLLALTLPASAAPPARGPAEVIVVNEPGNPVPVGVEGEVAVTGGNNAPVNVAGEVTIGNVNPVPVSGDVSATVQGSVDVQGPLSTKAVYVDEDFFVPSGYEIPDPPAHLTGSLVEATGSSDEFMVVIGLTNGDALHYLVQPGEQVVLTYPAPLFEVDRIFFVCGDACSVFGYFIGY